MKIEQVNIESQSNEEDQKYRFSIVWTKIPCFSTILPCLGHVGICKSDGQIYDYLGYGIHSGELGFNKPMRYLSLLDDTMDAQRWDKSIVQASEEFSMRNHNIFTNNCHHHVARALNIYKYKGKQNWSQFDVWRMTMRAQKCYNQPGCFRCFGV